MKHYLIALLLGCSSLLVAAPEAVPVLERAKTENKPIAIYFTGPDYQRAGENYKKNVWENSAFADRMKKDFILMTVDDEPPSKEKKKKDTTLNQYKTEFSSWPALVVIDGDGRICGHQGNIAFVTEQDIKKTARFMAKIHKNITERNRLFESAEKLSGAEKAASLAQAIIVIEPHVPGKLWRRDYAPIIDAVKTADPEDQSGYTRRFNYDLKGIKEKIGNFAKEKDFKGLDDFIRQELRHPKNKALNPTQLQEVCLAAHLAYKEDKERPAKKWNMLKAGAAFAPESHLGYGFRGTLCYNGQGEVAIPYGWYAKDIKDGKFDWNIVMGCKMHFDHAGDYIVTFSQEKGKETFAVKSIQLTINKQRIALDPKEASVVGKGKIEFKLRIERPIPENAKISLRVNGTYSGSDDSQGTIGVHPVLNLE